MGKDLKGKELGTGLRQRKDGRYEARAKINGIDINLYDVDLKKLKILFEKAKEEARNNIDFKTWIDVYNTIILCRLQTLPNSA